MKKLGKSLFVLLGAKGDHLYHTANILAIAKMTSGKISIAGQEHKVVTELFGNSVEIEHYINIKKRRRITHPLTFLKLAKEIKQHSFDNIFIPYDNGSLKLLAKLTGIKNIYMLPKKTRSNKELYAWFFRNYEFDPILKKCGIEVDYSQNIIQADEKMKLKITKQFKECPRPWILLGVHGMRQEKCWSQENFASLITKINQKIKCTIFIFGGEDVCGKADFLIKQTAAKNIISLPHMKFSLQDSLALANVANLYAGNDNFPFNLSVNAGLKSFCLYRSKEAVLNYRPWSSGVVAPQNGNVNSLTVDMVMEKFSLIDCVKSA